jgi:hypothetical protein
LSQPGEARGRARLGQIGSNRASVLAAQCWRCVAGCRVRGEPTAAVQAPAIRHAGSGSRQGPAAGSAHRCERPVLWQHGPYGQARAGAHHPARPRLSTPRIEANESKGAPSLPVAVYSGKAGRSPPLATWPVTAPWIRSKMRGTPMNRVGLSAQMSSTSLWVSPWGIGGGVGR